MKCSNFIFVLTMPLIVLSCSKDDSEALLSNDSLIVGEWNATDISAKGYFQYEGWWGEQVTEYIVLDAISDNNFGVQISRSPNQIVSSGSFNLTLSTTNLNFDSIYLAINDLMFLNSGSWSINSDKLLVSSGGDTQSYKIVDINDASLTISKTIDSEVDFFEQKSPVVINVLISFKKI